MKKGATKLTEEQIKRIKELYTLGRGVTFIGKDLKLHYQQIWKYLKSNGLLTRKRSKHLYCDEDYFETINSIDKAYFLGFIIADGNVSVSGARTGFSISLQEGDGYILENLIKKIRHEGKLSHTIKNNFKNAKDQKVLRIYSKKIANDLINLGVIPAKSHFTYFPDIEEKYWSHFIRGVFDGDGCISVDKTVSFNIIGNNLLINKIKEILYKKLGVIARKNLHDSRDKYNINTIRFGKIEDLIKIREYLYQDCEDLFLTRKREKFESIKENTIKRKKLMGQMDKIVKIVEKNIDFNTYYYLWMVKDGSTYLTDRNKVFDEIKEKLLLLGYLTNNNELTQKGIKLLEEIEGVKEVSNKKIDNKYELLHKKLENELIVLTKKKQKVINGKHSFLCNAKDLEYKLSKAIKKYKLEDNIKIEKLLLRHIFNCHKANWEFSKLIEYYIEKNNISQLASDYFNFDEKEEVKTVEKTATFDL